MKINFSRIRVAGMIFLAGLVIATRSPAADIFLQGLPADHPNNVSMLLAAKDSDEPKKEIPTYYKLLKQAMDQFFAVIESIANDKTLTVAQQQQKVEQFIRVARWGPEKKDTFFSFDMQGKMLVSVYQPDLVGKDMSNFQDPLGTKPFADMLRLLREKGEGFLNYAWPSYDGKFSVPHVAFVRLMRQWDRGFGVHSPLDVIEGYTMKDVAVYVLDNSDPLPAQDSEGTDQTP